MRQQITIGAKAARLITNAERLARGTVLLGWRNLLAPALVAAMAAPALGGPEGAAVVRGDVSITQVGSQTVITASDRAIINYRSFDIGASEAVRFIQPDSGSRVLNRIESASPTRIDGSLMANGRVYIVNPAGVIFAGGSRIDVAALYAAGGQLTNTDFVRGLDHFTNVKGEVVNRGTINTSAAVLIGSRVLNAGTIIAPQGTVVMAAGTDVLVGEERGHVFVRVSGEADSGADGKQGAVANTGTVEAPRGQVSMAAGDVLGVAILNAGRIKAANVAVQGQGTGEVRVSGVVDARNQADTSGGTGGTNDKGGRVEVTGQYVGLDHATIDASGSAGGGEVLIGGDAHGLGDVAHAQQVFGNTGTSINASADLVGDGGKVVLWSDHWTAFGGSIDARGGTAGGNGGWIETSSMGALTIEGARVNATGVGGRGGSWLLDPTDVTLSTAATANMSGSPNFAPTGAVNTGNVQISTIVTALQAGNNVSVVTTSAGAGPNGGSITVSNPISVNLTGGGTQTVTLTLTADSFILVNGAISGTGNGGDTFGVTLNSGATTSAADKSITINQSITSFANSPITLNSNFGAGASGGPITLAAGLDAGTGGINITAQSVSQTGGALTGGLLTLAGAGAGSFTLNSATNAIAQVGGTINGALTLVNNANLTVNLFDSQNNAIDITAQTGTLTVGGDVRSGTGTVALTADTMSFGAFRVGGNTVGPVLSAGVTLKPFTASRPVFLGDSGGGGNLNLSDTDLLTALTSSLTIGSTASTALTTLSKAGGLDLSAGGFAFNVLAGSLTTSNVFTNTNLAINLTAQTGTLTVGGNLLSGTGAISLTADTMSLGAVNIGSGATTTSVTFRPFSAGRNVFLGDTGGAGNLNLSAADLLKAKTAALVVGRTDSTGTTTLSQAAGGLDLSTGAYTVTVNSGSVTSNQFTTAAAVTYNIGQGAAGTLNLNQALTTGGSAIVFNGGTSGDTFNIKTVAASNPVSVNGNGGVDVVTVGNSGSVANIGANVSINGGGDGDTVTYDDSAEATLGRTYTLDSTAGISRSGITGVVTLTNLGTGGTVNVNAGTLADTVNIVRTATGQTWNVAGGTGIDAFAVGSAGSVGTIAGNVAINGGGNSDTVTYDDSAEATLGRTYTLDSTAGISRSGITGVVTLTNLGAAGVVNVNAGTLADTVNIVRTAAGQTWNVAGGTGLDAFTVGNSSSVAGILGNVSINGGGNVDTVTYDDSAEATLGRTYTLDSTSGISRSGITGAVTATNLGAGGSVTVNAGTLADTITVARTAAGQTWNVNAGTGGDTITIGGAGSVANIAGAVVVDGGTGANNTLTYDDSASGTNNTYTVTGTTIQRDGGVALVTFSNAQIVNVNAGGGTDLFTVGSAITTLSLALNGGGGNDTFDIAGGSILGVDGGAGATNVLNYNDAGNAAATVYAINDNSIARSGNAVGYANVQTIAVNGGSNSNTYNIASSATGTAMTVTAQTGGDIFNVGGLTNTVDALLGTVTLDGGTGSNTLQYIDTAAAAGANTYAVSSAAVTRTGAAATNYSNVQTLNLTGGNNANTINVNSVPGTTTVTGGSAVDTFNISAASTALGGGGNDIFNVGGGFNATIDGQTGTNTLNFNDAAFGTATTYTITSASVVRGAGTVGYSNIGTLNVNGGTNNNTYAVNSTSATTTATGGAGADVFNVASGASVTVDGAGGSDTLNYNDAAFATSTTYTITNASVARSGMSVGYSNLETVGVNGGTNNNTYNVNSVSSAATTVTAGAGTDTFNVAGGVVATVDGAGNTDALNYDDTAFATASTYTITSSTVARGAATLTYSNFETLGVSGGTAANTYAVNSTGATTTVTGQGNADTFNISATSTALGGGGNDIFNVGGGFNATIDGQTGTNTLNFNDAAFGTATTYTITSSSVVRGAGTVGYSNIGTLNVNGGTNGNTYAINSTGATTTVTAQGGDDTFNISATAASLGGGGNDTFNVAGGVGGSVDGGTGTNSLSYTDASTANNTYVFTNAAITRGGTLTYANIGTVTGQLGSGANTVIVRSVGAATPMTITAGSGDTAFFVNSNGTAGTPNADGTVDLIANQLTLNGGAGVNSITLNDRLDTIADPDTVSLTATTVGAGGGDSFFSDGLNFGSLTFSNVGSISILAGSDLTVATGAVLGANTLIDTKAATNRSLLAGTIDGLFTLTADTGSANATYGVLGGTTNLHGFSSTANLNVLTGNVTTSSPVVGRPISGITLVGPTRLDALVALVVNNGAAGATNANISAQAVDAQSDSIEALTLTAGAGNITLGAVGNSVRLGGFRIISANDVTGTIVKSTLIKQDAGTSLTSFTGVLDTTTAAGVDLVGTAFTLTGGANTVTGSGDFKVDSSGLLTLDTTPLVLGGRFVKDSADTLRVGNSLLKTSITTNEGDIVFKQGNLALGANLTLSTAGTTAVSTDKIEFDHDVNLAGFNLTLKTDVVQLLGGANSVTGNGSGVLTFLPTTTAGSIGVAGGLGTMQISEATLLALADQAAGRIDIGDASLGTGLIQVAGGATPPLQFRDPVRFLSPGAGGRVEFIGAVQGVTNASITTIAGDFTTIGGDLTTAGQTVSITGGARIRGGRTIDTTGSSTPTGGNVIVTGETDAEGGVSDAITIVAGLSGNVSLQGVGQGTSLAGFTVSSSSTAGTNAITAGGISVSSGAGTHGLLTAGTGGITLNGGSFSFAGAGVTNGNMTVSNSGLMTTSADITVNGGRFFQSGSGAVTLNGDVRTKNGDLIFAGPVSYSANRLLDTTFSGSTSGLVNILGGVTGTGDLTINSVDDVLIGSSITLSSAAVLSVRAGVDGTGGVKFTQSNVTLRADTISLRAGDGVGGAATAAQVFARGESGVTVAPVFLAAAGGATAPTTFTIRSDGAIDDTTTPSMSQFGAAPNLVYVSDDAAVTIGQADRALAANLQITGNASQRNLISTAINPNTLVLHSPTDVAAAVTTTGDLTIGDAGAPIAGFLRLTGASVLQSDNGVLFINQPIAAQANDLTLAAKEIQIGAAVGGSGNLLIQPIAAGAGIFLGSVVDDPNALDLTNAELAFLADGFNAVTIGRANGTGAIATSSAVQAFLDPVTIQAPSAGGTIAVNHLLTGSGNASITLDSPGTTLAANIRTAGNAVTVRQGMTLAANLITIDTTNDGTTTAATGASVLVGGPTSSDATANDRSLTINAGTDGAAIMSGAVGATAGTRLHNLTLTGASNTALSNRHTLVGAVVTTGAQTYSGRVAATGNLTTDRTGAGVLATDPASISLDGLLTANQALQITTAGTAADFIKLGGGVTNASFSLTANSGIAPTLICGPFSGTDVLFNSAVQLCGDTTINGSTSVVFDSTVDNQPSLPAPSPFSLTVNAPTATFTGVVGGTTLIRDLNVTGTTLSFPAVSTLGNINATGSTVGFGNVVAGGNVTVSGGAVTLNRVTSVGSQFYLTADNGTTTLLDVGSGTNLQATGAGAGINFLNTNGNVRFQGNTTITTSDGTVTFENLVDSAASGLPVDLTVNAGGSDKKVAFFRPVGSTNVLRVLTLNSGGIDLSAGSVTTTGAQTYGGAAVIGRTDLTLAGPAVTFGSTLDSKASENTKRSLTVNTASSGLETRFTGKVGNIFALNSATLNGTGNVTFLDGATLGGDLAANKAASLTGAFIVNGAALFASTATANGSLVAGGPLTFANTANLTGTFQSVNAGASFAGLTTINGSLTTAGAMAFNNAGVTTLGGVFTSGGPITVAGNLEIAADSTIDAGASTMVFRGTIDAAASAVSSNLGLFSSLPITSTTTLGVTTQTTAIKLNDSIGATRALTGLTIGRNNAYTAAQPAATVLFTKQRLGADGNVTLSATNTFAAIKADTLVINTGAGGFTMGLNQKMTALGALAVTTSGGATLSDITSISTINVNAGGGIVLLARNRGVVADNNPNNSGVAAAAVNDSGLDLVAADRITLTAPSITVNTANSSDRVLFATNEGPGDGSTLVAAVSHPAFKSAGTNRAVDDQLFTTKFSTGGANVLGAFDLRAEGASTNNVANSLAGALPRDKETHESSTPITISKALRDKMQQMELIPKDVTLSQMMEFMIGRSIFLDREMSGKTIKNPNADRSVSVSRLAQLSLEAAVDAFNKLFFPEDPNVDVSETISGVVGRAWATYSESGEGEKTGVGFREWLQARKDGQQAGEDEAAALDVLNRARTYVQRVDGLGLTNFEASRVKRAALVKFCPGEMPVQQLEDAVVGQATVAAR